MGMGGAFIAVADDANTTYWNPAGLTQLEASEFTCTPTLYNRDEYNYDDFVSLVIPLGVEEQSWGSLGFSFINSGTDPELDWGKNETIDRWFWLSGGIKIFDGLSLGANLRLRDYEEKIKINTGWVVEGVAGPYSTSDEDSTFGVDLALFWKSGKFSFGILWQDMNEPELELFGAESKCKGNLRPGIAFRPDDKTVIALDMYDATGSTHGDADDVSQDLRIGVERWFTEYFVLRAGVYHLNSDTDANKAVTFGAGLKELGEKGGIFSSGQLDYCLLYWIDPASGASEFTHQIGLSFRF